MISTAGKYVWLVGGGMLTYSCVIGLGLLTDLIRPDATPLCISLLCFASCLWYTNAYLEVKGVPFSWGLVANALGWGAVSLAFLVPTGWHWPFSLAAGAFIAAGGVAAWLAIREHRRNGTDIR